MFAFIAETEGNNDEPEEYERLEKEYREGEDATQAKTRSLIKMNKIEDSMKTRWYKHLEATNGTDRYPMKEMGRPSYMRTSEYKEQVAEKIRRESAINKRENELINKVAPMDVDDEEGSEQEACVDEQAEQRDLQKLRWSPKLEHEVEEMLIANEFNFRRAAKELQSRLNNDADYSQEGDK